VNPALKITLMLLALVVVDLLKAEVVLSINSSVKIQNPFRPQETLPAADYTVQRVGRMYRFTVTVDQDRDAVYNGRKMKNNQLANGRIMNVTALIPIEKVNRAFENAKLVSREHITSDKILRRMKQSEYKRKNGIRRDDSHSTSNNGLVTKEDILRRRDQLRDEKNNPATNQRKELVKPYMQNGEKEATVVTDQQLYKATCLKYNKEICSNWKSVFGKNPTVNDVYFMKALFVNESNYGRSKFGKNELGQYIRHEVGFRKRPEESFVHLSYVDYLLREPKAKVLVKLINQEIKADVGSQGKYSDLASMRKYFDKKPKSLKALRDIFQKHEDVAIKKILKENNQQSSTELKSLIKMFESSFGELQLMYPTVIDAYKKNHRYKNKVPSPNELHKPSKTIEAAMVVLNEKMKSKKIPKNDKYFYLARLYNTGGIKRTGTLGLIGNKRKPYEHRALLHMKSYTQSCQLTDETVCR